METIDSSYLEPTSIIDSDHPEIQRYAHRVTENNDSAREKAVKLFYAVRDGIWYDPYCPFYLPEHYRSSNVLRNGRGYCVCKAGLLCALARAVEIPSRVGFADVRNHLTTRQLMEFMGSNLFVYHGYTELFLEGQWVKATPAFNRELCQKHKVAPLEFNGRDDALLQSYNLDKKQFMEYVTYHGTYADIPIQTIVAAWENAYGKDRVRGWIEMLEKTGKKSLKDFY
ncbi:MAG TPA: transglutaminase domain-containing protein, partial [Desulfobacteraceae bacterium]|nr:transglutaminase domain-containing protein [Desulfobacteraceae bacterium]